MDNDNRPDAGESSSGADLTAFITKWKSGAAIVPPYWFHDYLLLGVTRMRRADWTFFTIDRQVEEVVKRFKPDSESGWDLSSFGGSAFDRAQKINDVASGKDAVFEHDTTELAAWLARYEDPDEPRPPTDDEFADLVESMLPMVEKSDAEARALAVADELRRIEIREEAQERRQRADEGELTWTTAKQRATKPPMLWRVHQLVPLAGVGVVFGPTYVGKSLLVLDLALSYANRLPSWMGFSLLHDDNGEHPHAGIVLMEGVDGFPGRERAWLAGHPGAAGDGLLTFEYQWVNMASPDYVERFIESVRETTMDDDTPFAPGLLVVDTQGLASAADENDRTQMRRLYRLAKRIAAELRCAVILVTHPGHDNPDRPAGASSQEQDADFVVRVRLNELYVKKVKEAGTAGTYRMFAIEPAEDSVYVRPLVELVDQAAEVRRQQHAYDVRIMCAVKRLQGVRGISKNQLFKDVGGNKHDFDAAVGQLLASARLRNNSANPQLTLLWTDEEIACSDAASG